MPTPTVNISQVLESQVSGIASNFLNEGLKALPDIGVALLSIAGLFVVSYWTARAFGWKVKLPKRPPSQAGIFGNPKKVHLEKDSGNIWTFISRFGQIKPFSFGRKSRYIPGSDTGLASGFGSTFDLDDDHDIFTSHFDDDYSDLDAEDGQNGFYADPSYNAPYTSDSGPDSRPGLQSGALAGDLEFFNKASDFFYYYSQDLADSYNYDEFNATKARARLYEDEQTYHDAYDNHAATTAANWAYLFPHLGSIDGLATAPNLSMAESSELLRHAARLNSLKQQSLPDLLPDITSDDLADMDIDYDMGAYDH
ncbi:hypothetical protein B1757_12410 [Acidithiobacillus marinus]|uniref:Uncharacterized protein n=1 Tax=Acidithiobacillus marinus TaxID=187490 RepID=A0A2I1DJP4_9PROT|nr:hypothetical protein [Acidithiobacillus marinus]PKY10075.1 hypothetical protein B1757_12410 [Acidithiobacillus marinus]